MSHLPFKKNLIVCVTGATGFVGFSLTQKLISEGHKVKYLTRSSFKTSINNAERFVGDLTNPEFDLSYFLSNCDVIYHCAGEKILSARMSALHVYGTKKIVDAVIKEQNRSGKIIHWIQLSSCGLYGCNSKRLNEERWLDEESVLNPNNNYERTKLEAELIVQNTLKDSHVKYSILRPSNIISSDNIGKTLRRLIWMIRYRIFFFAGDAGAISNFVHIDDVVRALILLAHNSQSFSEIYLLSNDCFLEDLVDKISHALKRNNKYARVTEKQLMDTMFLIRIISMGFEFLPKVDILLSRTHYRSGKIEKKLGFHFEKNIPQMVYEILCKNN